MSLSNKSGIKPVGVSLIIEPVQISETTEFGIVQYSTMELEREFLKQTDGVVLAIGPQAFYDEGEVRCKEGDRVVMRAYAGMLRKGVDGNKYRIVADSDIIGILESEE